jgi:hypothetical protein
MAEQPNDAINKATAAVRASDFAATLPGASRKLRLLMSVPTTRTQDSDNPIIARLWRHVRYSPHRNDWLVVQNSRIMERQKWLCCNDCL